MRYKRITFLIPLSCITACLFAASASLRVGLGGSIVEQNYSILEQDTISITTEPKILADGGYTLTSGNQKLTGDFSTDIGENSTWALIALSSKYTTGNFKTDLSEIIEGRIPYAPDGDIVGYTKHRFNLGMQQKFEKQKLSARLWVEGKKFSDIKFFYYNYDLLRSRLSYDFPVFSADCQVSWSYSFRSVQDSADANYDRRQLDMSMAKLWEQGHFGEFILAYDRRHFPSETERGSYSAIYLWNSVSFIIDPLFVSPALELEKRSFNTEDDIYFSYNWLDSEIMTEKDFGQWRFGAGPKVTRQKANIEYIGESFWELALKISANHLNYGKFWLFSDVSIGNRFYKDVPDTVDLYSNFAFVDISTMVSFWFAQSLRADITATYTPEWHARKRDDIETSYISFAVRYEFK